MRKGMTLLSCLVCGVVFAGWFGSNKEEELTKHVADVLREPTRIIAQAQVATDAGDTEEAIRLFRQAQSMILKIEKDEDTSGSAFAALRLKKFHCLSMLDDLALRRAEVKDVRQSVTDTSELAQRLAAERAQLEADAEANRPATNEPLKPKTSSEELAEANRDVTMAQAAIVEANAAIATCTTRLEQARKGVVGAMREIAQAETAVVTAQKEVQAYEQRDDATTGLLNEMLVEAEDPQVTLEEAQKHLAKMQKALETAKDEVKQAEKALADAQAVLKEKQDVLTEALARKDFYATLVSDEEKLAAQEAQLAAAEEERKLKAEELLKAQKAAEEAAKVQAAAEKFKASKQAAEEAAQKAKKLKDELAWCQELWQTKRIDTLEAQLKENLEAYPDEPAFLVLLAKLRLLEGEAEDALELVALIPASGPTGIQAKQVGAGAYLMLKKPLDAMKMLEAIVKLTPKDPAPYFNMAMVYLTVPQLDKQHQMAERYYRKSVELGGKRSAAIEKSLNME